MRIGIIGFGYVGGAIAWAHRDQDIIIRDPKLKASIRLVCKGPRGYSSWCISYT